MENFTALSVLILCFVIHGVTAKSLVSSSRVILDKCFENFYSNDCSEGFEKVISTRSNKWCCIKFMYNDDEAPSNAMTSSDTDNENITANNNNRGEAYDEDAAATDDDTMSPESDSINMNEAIDDSSLSYAENSIDSRLNGDDDDDDADNLEQMKKTDESNLNADELSDTEIIENEIETGDINGKYKAVADDFKESLDDYKVELEGEFLGFGKLNQDKNDDDSDESAMDGQESDEDEDSNSALGPNLKFEETDDDSQAFDEDRSSALADKPEIDYSDDPVSQLEIDSEKASENDDLVDFDSVDEESSSSDEESEDSRSSLDGEEESIDDTQINDEDPPEIDSDSEHIQDEDQDQDPDSSDSDRSQEEPLGGESNDSVKSDDDFDENSEDIENDKQPVDSEKSNFDEENHDSSESDGFNPRFDKEDDSLSTPSDSEDNSNSTENDSELKNVDETTPKTSPSKKRSKINKMLSKKSFRNKKSNNFQKLLATSFPRKSMISRKKTSSFKNKQPPLKFIPGNANDLKENEQPDKNDKETDLREENLEDLEADRRDSQNFHRNEPLESDSSNKDADMEESALSDDKSEDIDSDNRNSMETDDKEDSRSRDEQSSLSNDDNLQESENSFDSETSQVEFEDGMTEEDEGGLRRKRSLYNFNEMTWKQSDNFEEFGPILSALRR